VIRKFFVLIHLFYQTFRLPLLSSLLLEPEGYLIENINFNLMNNPCLDPIFSLSNSLSDEQSNPLQGARLKESEERRKIRI
jgi:hypothetical protein